MDNQTESRNQFEAWATKRALMLDKDTDAWGREKYKYHMIQALWDGWQANRAAIVVDIDWPAANDDHWKEGEEGAPLLEAASYDEAIDDCADTLRALGITVKE